MENRKIDSAVIVNMVASTATMEMSVSGFGNSKEYLIQIKNNGGQFEQARAYVNQHGDMVLSIVGTWEMDEFVQALNSAYFNLIAKSNLEGVEDRIDVGTRINF